ncbi:hypothetical protein P389DRAFT_136983, partial [Cystobasidium minutum MCA 4210]|uniref:uncharacterized protein n=1 Tax=Cystobasidium minutum MCA 4210 TaxID=1397322 RepID=UPI0034CE7A55
CKLCDQAFTRAHDLKRHNTIHEKFKAYPCPYCSKAFGRKDALTRHLAVRG